MARAMALHGRGALAEAVAVYRQILDAWPGNADVRFNLAVALKTLGRIDEAIDAYGSGALGEPAEALSAVDHIVAIGSDGMMNAVAQARHGVLARHLKARHKAIGSINSPMQCMMKEICAQCLQVHRDPETGLESVVFSCFNQDQDLDRVDFKNLRSRLGQNSVQEKVTRQWIDRSLRQVGLRRETAE